MLTGKRFSITLLFVSVLIFLSIPSYANKSVYVTSDTLTSQLQSYKIEGSTLVYQTDYTCLLSPSDEYGAVGIAIDESGYGQFLFVTFEYSDEIELVNAKTMEYVDMVIATGAGNLAGIVMDTNNSKLYAVDRYTDHLYSWTWDPAAKNLTTDFDEPYYTVLEGIDTSYQKGAFGIALDEENGFLYVADNTKKIKYYNTNTWSKEGEIPPTSYASCDVISIAIDVPNQLLYYGSIGDYGEGDTHLYQYDIGAEDEDSVDVGCPVAGIAVDQQTSLVYLTTYGGPYDDDDEPFPKDRLMVYNSSLQRLWYSDDIGNPAGVAVAANVAYKEPVFSIVKDNNDQEDGCVEPFVELFPEYLVFDIYWDANTHSDTNAFVIDYLPADLEYCSSIPEANDYNSTYHTVTWDLPDFNENSSDSFQITTKVKSDITCPCGRLTNTAYLEGDNYCSPATIDVNICSWSDVLYVDKDANGTEIGTSWDNAFNELTDALHIAKRCSGSYDQVWVAKETYKPVYNATGNYQDQSFKLVSNVGLLGHFTGFETSPYQRNLADANNETILDGLIETGKTVNKIVTAEGIDGAFLDGFTIKSASSKGIYINDSNLSIVNCEFLYNSGDGVYCENPSGLDIHNCLFLENYFSGLNVKDNNSNTIVTNCIFEGIDYAEYGANIEDSSVELNDCIFQKYFSKNGIKCSGGNLTVIDCNVQSASNYGLYASDCNIIIEHSIMSNNQNGGLNIYRDLERSLTLKDSVIRYNNGDGIFLNHGFPSTIINNWIHNNTGNGITISYHDFIITIRNNTIYKNSNYGISSSGWGTEPEILNCIIYDNTSGSIEGGLSNVNFCYMDDPGFMNIETDPNDLHISADSPCRDNGDSNDIPSGEIDIDCEGRIKYDDVDIGADEYYWSPADFDLSGNVDFIDYAILANAFRCTPPDEDYVKKCDLEDNDYIDLADLQFLCEDWLWECAWETGWMKCMGGGGMGGQGMGGGLMLDLERSLIARPQRLAARSDKFYVVDASKTAAERAPVYIDENVISQILAWLDKIWLESDELRKAMTEEEFLKFRKLIEDDLLRFLAP